MMKREPFTAKEFSEYKVEKGKVAEYHLNKHQA